MATRSSILSWRIARTEEPSALKSVELQRIRHNRNDLPCMQDLLYLCESSSAVFDSLRLHGLHPWNSPGQDIGVGIVRGILQAIILECVAFPFARASSQTRD